MLARPSRLAATIWLSLAAFVATPRRALAAEPVDRDEARPLYRQVPNVTLRLASGRDAELASLWANKPVLLTLFYRKCTGTCSPFLRSLRSAIARTGGLGRDYQVVSLSFDERDTIDDARAQAESLGLAGSADWQFAVASRSDVEAISAAIGFSYRLDPDRGQYDHPSLVAAIVDGRVVRVLLGNAVDPSRLRETVWELRGSFVPFYALPGETLFRCLRYDERSGDALPDAGLALLVVPGATAIAATALLFRRGRRAQPGLR